MSLGHPWLLLLAVLPLWWAWRERQLTARRLPLALKLGALLCVVIALAEPRLSVNGRKVAVAILADTSSSVTSQDLDRASQLVSAITAARGRNSVRVLPFARTVRQASSGEAGARARLAHTAGEGGEATDFETALRDALPGMPSGQVPRVVLITDGKENQGSIARGAALLRQLGVPVDTFALLGRPKPGFRIEAVTMPSAAFTGERFAIDFTLRSPTAAKGVIEIAADGKRIGSGLVEVEAGESHLRAHASISEAGAIGVTGVIRLDGLGEASFGRALTLRRPGLLLVSDDPPGWEKHLADTLNAAKFNVNLSLGVLPPSLEEYQVLVLNNWDLQAIPPVHQARIEDFVKRGGGLLVIGGEHNIYVERKKAPESALDRALPAVLAPPRTPEDRCIVLIIDKSASMTGRKIDLARQAAAGVVEHLRAEDMVGVLIFDTTSQWAAPIAPVGDGATLKQMIAGIMTDGGTQIALALTEAHSKILPVTAAYKHILLLTDGISEAGNSLELAERAAAERITISTIGLGTDVNRPYLEKVAALSMGKSYFLLDPSGLEQIVLRDVMEHTGTTTVEKDVAVSVIRNVELLEAVEMGAAPPLKGYVRFTAKPTAETVLQVDGQDPLLARWQYGLGRSMVFTSDAKPRWAENWVSWKGFDRFWANVARDLLPHAQPSEATMELDSANGELVVNYRLGQHVEAPEAVPDIFAFGPGGFQRKVDVRKVAEGAYRGRVAVADRTGMFRVRPLAESRTFQELGYYREPRESSDFGNDEPLLRRVSEFTGGRFNPQPREVFQAGGRTAASTTALWPGFLALAILLNLAELVLRKWHGILETLGRAQQTAAVREG